MFKDKELRAAFDQHTKGLDRGPINLYEGIMFECFKWGVYWAEMEMLHHVEDANSLQFPEQAE